MSEKEERAVTECFETNSYTETEQIGRELALHLKNGGFVAFYGDLGAGKTAFTRGIGEVICPDAEVCSPTYAIINEYKVGSKTVMCHVDAYRIEDDDDLYSTGFYDLCEEPGMVTVVEWCEKIPFAIPSDAIIVKIEKTGEHSRKIFITLPEA